MIVDAHLHIWNRLHGMIGASELVTPIRNGLIRIGNRTYQGMPATHLDCTAPAEFVLAEFQAAGVDCGVVVQEPMDGEQNDYCLEVKQRFPGRFFCHALPDFFSPESLVAQIDRLFAAGFRGIKVPANHLAMRKIELDSPRLLPAWERIHAAGAIVAIDFSDGQLQVPEMERVLRLFQGFKLAIGHFGMPTRQGWPGQLALCRFENVHIETGAITWLYREEGYPFLGAIQAIGAAIKVVGIEKLMWGSDWPRTMVDITYRNSLDFIRHRPSALTAREKELLLGENAVRFYGFDVQNPPAVPVPLISSL